MAARDDAKYVEFIAAQQDRLRRVAYAMTADWSQADDVTQEALIKLYLAWPRLERAGGLASYARTVIVTTAIDQERKRKRRREGVLEEHHDRGLDDGTGPRAERSILVDGLRAIPPRQRACIVLRYFEDMSVAETARVLDCSEGNVKSQTAHGIAALRRELVARGMTLELKLGA